MSQKPLSDKALRDTLAFYDAAHGVAAKAAILAGIGVNTFKHRLQMARNKFGITAPTVKADQGIQKRAEQLSELNQLQKEVVVLRQALSEKGKITKIPAPKRRPTSDRDRVRVIMMDSHGSHIDPAAFAAFRADVAILDPDEFVGIGDHVDAGGFLAAHHTMGYLAQLDESAWADDLGAWENQLNSLQEAAGNARWTLLEGNHEKRIEQWAVQQTLGNRKDAEMLMRAMSPQDRLNYVKRGIDYVRYGELREGVPVRGAVRLGKCYFTHGTYCGPNAARNHAAKFGAPVVYGHTHTPSTYFGKTVHGGTHAAWNFGCLSKMAPRYMHNTPDNWAHGYGIQLIAKSGHFTTIHVPIIKGVSYLPTAFRSQK
jgi:hypothetical protein